jgi:hypothetical protein
MASAIVKREIESVFALSLSALNADARRCAVRSYSIHMKIRRNMRLGFRSMKMFCAVAPVAPCPRSVQP